MSLASGDQEGISDKLRVTSFWQYDGHTSGWLVSFFCCRMLLTTCQMSAVVTWTTEMISPLCECDLESQSLCSQQPLHHNHAQDYSGAAMNKVHPPKVERFREKKLQLKSNVGIKCPKTLTGYDPSEYCKQWLCGDGSSGQQKSLRQ